MLRPRRIAVIAPSRSPLAEPFSGGLVAHVWALCTNLLQRGHDVTVFASPGSDPRLPLSDIALTGPVLSEDARADVSMPPDVVLDEHHAYLSVMMQLAAQPGRYDVVHNHSLHHLPIAMARFVSTPMVTTLHTPPTPWLESAVQSGPRTAMRFVAVSEHTAGRWRPLLDHVDVVPNGVDLARWPAGPGGCDLAWTGRLVPEKAPHLAIHAARRAGRRLVLAGPVDDRDYYKLEIEPLLGDDVVHAGHLDQAALSELVRTSAAVVVTPVWDEPYGLVVAEALASGTPVAGFRRGGVPEVVDDSCARLVRGGDIAALAGAIDEAVLLPRAAARARAEQACSLELMMDRYEALLTGAVAA
ncbi:Glycosyltransferase involved in cell wall bisynthesis [Jatrophihabitans endophyticus]|uniref:Glycosyltransferase involved in cell wall bisynthesis n=1 Tax=Jatrophihabitans endophyticus TaxID=1206085 RepID=A0A1M5Q787_9ACTN|nr:glycosyltransferase [Jatrophihabitans endophyticus]SHH09353.1 Glycosyltransferase involved in cell wall bisynthesis [Jatrophihabitans endophyticus]